MINLFIDSRENKFIKLFNKKINDFNEFIKIKQLSIGDFYIILNNNTDIIIERKTIDDLNKSLLDKRYFDQKNRLQHLMNNNNKNIICMYLIEGTNKNDFNNYWSILNNLIIKYNIFVLQSDNLEETGNIIFNIFTRNLKNKFEVNNNDLIDLSIYKKSNSLNPDKCFLSQLCMIPNISNKKALAIKKKFNNFKDLFSKLNNKNYEEKVKEFSEIFIDENNKRRIGTKTSQKIVDFLFFENLSLYENELTKSKPTCKKKEIKKYLFT